MTPFDIYGFAAVYVIRIFPRGGGALRGIFYFLKPIATIAINAIRISAFLKVLMSLCLSSMPAAMYPMHKAIAKHTTTFQAAITLTSIKTVGDLFLF
jgi:hypothetical protein